MPCRQASTAGDDRETLSLRLGDDHSIEWIAMQ
jgi:hypothetical protein